MNFVKNADLGFTKERLLMVQLNTDSVTVPRLNTFRDALKQRSDVKLDFFFFDAPSSQSTWDANFAFDNMKDREFNVQLKQGDENYLAAYGSLNWWPAGFIRPVIPAGEYVVNETLVKMRRQ